eukprot:EG_transcript_9552
MGPTALSGAALLRLLLVLLAAVGRVQPTALFRTGWMKHYGLEPNFVTNVSPDPALYRPVQLACNVSGQHGNVCEYGAAGAVPPTTDSGWFWAPDPVNVGQALASVLYTSSGSTCLQYLDFTYFHSFLYLPPNASANVSVQAGAGFDDGLRVSVFNSQRPFGTVAGYVFMTSPLTPVSLQPFLLVGALNRIVLTQVDDCAPTNNLPRATLLIDGSVVPTVTCSDGVQDGDETAVDAGGYCAAGAGGMPSSRDCAWGPWAAWGSCSAYCAGGVQTRQRTHVQEAFMGGNGCVGASAETRGCNAVPCPTCGGLITDADGHTYRTVAIGGQCWMAQNLNSSTTAGGAPISDRKCGLGGSNVFAADNAFCANGAFYSWAAAMAGVTAFYPRPTVPAVVGICPGGPMGWRIPSVEDWDTLMGTLGNFSSKVLQRYGNACTGVACYRLGETGFNAPLLGYLSPYVNLTLEELDVEYHAYFWSSSRRYPFQAGNVGAASDDQIFAVKLRYDHHLVPWVSHTKRDYLSVRCVADLS